MPSDDLIYLDHSATTPLHPRVLEAMFPVLRDHFGNAGSIHRVGRRARRCIDGARDQVAELVGGDPRGVIFTSGGTEADNLAIQGVMRRGPNRGRRVVISGVEHHAVLHPAQSLARQGVADLQVVRIHPSGEIDLDHLQECLTEETVLVSLMHANNETGVLQPIETVGRLCRQRGILFHTDAVQSAGKVPIDLSRAPIDLLSLSGHKLNGPKGIGALYVADQVRLDAQILGGAQERGWRAGTENVAAIVGFGEACEIARQAERASTELTRLRERLEKGLLTEIAGAWLNGGKAPRLPHIVNIGFTGVEGESLVLALDEAGIAVSTGSACTSGSVDPSHVLLAMGQSYDEAQRAVRFSLGYGNSQEQIDRVVSLLPELIERLRAESPWAS